MKTFKYNVPEKVQHLFLDPLLLELQYDNRTYIKSIYLNIKKMGVLSEDTVEALMIQHGTVKEEDFTEVITQEDNFEKRYAILHQNIENYKEDENREPLILNIYNTNYSSMTYLIRRIGKEFLITKIDTNAEEGINNNLKSHLKNKSKNLTDNWTFDIVRLTDLDFDPIEPIYKYYYYDKNFKHNSNTGAGTITGWITHQEMHFRTRNKSVIQLNKTIRLIKEWKRK